MSRYARFSTFTYVGGAGSAACSCWVLPIHAPVKPSATVRAPSVARRIRPRVAVGIFITSFPFRMVSPTVPQRVERKVYDEAYFTRWYRDPRTRVHSPDSVRRKVRMVVGVTEYFLGRKLRSVLDIGAGE